MAQSIASEASARVQKKEEKKEPEKRAPKLATLWVDFQHEYIRTQKASTQAGYRIAWEKDLRPVIGKIAVDKIGTLHLARLRTRMQERGNIQSSVQQVEAKLITCLNWAKERGTLPANHLVPKLRWPKKEGKKHVQVYREDELELQIEHAQDLEERVLMLLQIDGALRIGECAGLAWRHIDWERGMTIGQNVCHGVLQDSPKGEVGTVPLTSRLKSALLKLRAARPDPEFVFIPIRGKRAHTTDQALAHITKKIQARAGLEVHGPHRNRHSVLTLLAERGESPYVLQALARHANIETTMRFYVHVNKLALARQAVGALEARAGKAKEELGKVLQMPARRSLTAY
ncbi:tyrosine-type recombinase/integrase [Nannocystis sp. ILAH1]|uniref:site-specific integrase n=1 Tax=Nannocystis sp. ILAH1 TaxID=2996789 RepID=UPI00226EECBA|nr:tyrosine-type recombinase/integrase [Nannocystis sp. ILAH1]